MGERLNKIPAQIIVCMIVLLGSFGLLFMLTFKEIPNNNKDVLQTLIGVVIGASLSPVMGWLFSTSKQPQKPL